MWHNYKTAEVNSIYITNFKGAHIWSTLCLSNRLCIVLQAGLLQ